MINLDKLTIGNIVLATKVPLYIDTGTTLIVVDNQTYDALITELGIQDAIMFSGNIGSIDCSFVDTLPSINFVFKGNNFPLSPGYYLLPSGGSCVFGIQSGDLPAGGWIIGDVFLRAFYTIYDIGNMQIGIANLTTSAQSYVLTPSGNPNSWPSMASNIYFNYSILILALLLTMWQF